MIDNDDKLIASFFERKKLGEVPDDGFSERVMNRLPASDYSRKVVINRIWTAVCTAAAVALFVLADGFALLRRVCEDILSDAVGSVASVNVTLETVAMASLLLSVLAVLTVYNTVSAD